MPQQLPIRWFSVDELLPNDGQMVLIREYFRGTQSGIYHADYEVHTYSTKFGFTYVERSYRHLNIKVTHWTPIPPINPQSNEKD